MSKNLDMDFKNTVNTPELPLVDTQPSAIDLFNRQEIIDQLIQLLNIVSDQRSSGTFALNGKWGTGKTFVLNKLMRQLLDYQDGEKYLVFHYNCWQYDYYDEPLVAIVAALMDSVDQENHLFSQNLRSKAKQGMALAKPIIEKLVVEFVEKKIGANLPDIVAMGKSGAETAEKANQKEIDTHEFDQYYAFKKAVQSTQKCIQTLSENRSVVIVVDELDRCLPAYAIKVLERLHHLFIGLSNTVVILAVDKDQLNQTVAHTFGANTDTAKYLQKFINLEIQLSVGEIKGGFFEKFADYFALFDNTLLETEFDFDAYIRALFSNIDIRNQERLMDRIKTVHNVLFPNIQKDYSFMCFELMWMVFSEVYGLTDSMPITYDTIYDRSYDEEYSYKCFVLKKGIMPNFTAYMKEQWNDNIYVSTHASGNTTWHRLSGKIDIPHLLIWYLYQMYPDTSTKYSLVVPESEIAQYQNNLEELKRVVNLLRIIK